MTCTAFLKQSTQEGPGVGHHWSKIKPKNRFFDLVESCAVFLLISKRSGQVCVSEEMELLEDKVRLLKLQEEKAILMRKDVVIEEKLCDVKVCFSLSL